MVETTAGITMKLAPSFILCCVVGIVGLLGAGLAGCDSSQGLASGSGTTVTGATETNTESTDNADEPQSSQTNQGDQSSVEGVGDRTPENTEPEVPNPVDEARAALESAVVRPWDGSVGSLLPSEFVVDGLDGSQAALGAYQGNVLLLNIWATWCVPCRLEFPHLVEIQEHYAEQGVRVVGLTVDGDLELSEIQAFASESDMSYTIVRSDSEAVMNTFAAPPLPGNFVFDRDGVLVYSRIGAPEEGLVDIREALEMALSRSDSHTP